MEGLEQETDDLEVGMEIDRNNCPVFDLAIGYIEDIIVDESFEQLQREFMNKYYEEFADEEENRLTYLPIFKEYIALMENHIESRLSAFIPNFNMEAFYSELSLRKDNLDGEVFDLLFTLSDFMAFKEMMLDYKAEKEGRTANFSEDLTVYRLNSSDLILNGDENYE